MKADETADILKFLALSDKAPANFVEFVAVEGTPVPRRKAVVPLAIDGIVHHGLRLEIVGPSVVPHGRPFFGLTAIMDAHVAGKVWHLGRLEFDPAGGPPHHLNNRIYKPAPPRIAGPHYHSFEDNIAFGAASCSKDGNLPVAYPFDAQFDNFQQVLSATEERFVIPGLWMEDPACLILLA